MSSDSIHPPFTEALATLCYCLIHFVESLDAAMHSDVEKGFLDDRKWMVLKSQIWGLLAQLKCGINIDPIEMESKSESEEALSLAQSPEPRIVTSPPPESSPFSELLPQDLILPMLHTPTPEPESLVPVPPVLLPKKYKFGPKNINDGPGFRMMHKQWQVPVVLKNKFYLLMRNKHPLPSLFIKLFPLALLANKNRRAMLLTLIPEETTSVACKHGGFGKPVPKNVSPLTNGDLRPMGLLVPDQDFEDFIGCQGAFFKWDLAGKVGHFAIFVPETLLVTEIWCLLKNLGIIKDEALLDLEAQEAGSNEDLDAEENQPQDNE
ncbi:hypothetical protein ARMGADRAFT_1033768 [Armillaria gallica]|uniref:Uncharacterized protein n=1 Tax=Armillaria gallica TaxID=47427 RepID=A0A2H3D4S4_ARMGA|nr:hypothetical protein ARMGADRAFT_1033768 [Armillaria gallica]